MGALYLASKLEECPIRMRDLINVYDLLLQRTAHTLAVQTTTPQKAEFKYVPMSYFGNTFYDLKDALVVAEMQILKRLTPVRSSGTSGWSGVTGDNNPWGRDGNNAGPPGSRPTSKVPKELRSSPPKLSSSGADNLPSCVSRVSRLMLWVFPR